MSRKKLSKKTASTRKTVTATGGKKTTKKSSSPSFVLSDDERTRILAREPRPSTDLEGYWIVAMGPKGSRVDTGRSGKWMVFIPKTEIDVWWERIAAAVRAGELGGSAKVSTARPNPNSIDPSKHVLIIYTNDADDEADVMRVRAALRAMGVTWPIPYKTDDATRRREYQVTGTRRISKYYE